MDANKRAELQRIGYVVRDTCGRCTYSDFMDAASFWGTCTVQTYQHLKHTDSKRHLSIHQSGWCPKFARSKTEVLAGFTEFAAT